VKRRDALLVAALIAGAPGALADARMERALDDDVDEVRFAAEGDLEIVTGATPGVVIEADDEVALEELEVRVQGDRLVVRQREEDGGPFAWIGRDSIRVRVIVRDLEHVEFAGSGDLHVSDVRDGDLEVEIAGHADCVLEALDLDRLFVEIAGRAECEVSGVARRQSVAIAGAGDYRGLGLETERTDVALSGMGDVEVHVNERLEAAVSGMGDVAYKGSPEVFRQVSGWGSVEPE
jgi:hypothetical protein